MIEVWAIGFLMGVFFAGYVIFVILHMLHGVNAWVSLRGPFHTRIGHRL